MAPLLDWEDSCRLCSENKTDMFDIFGDEGVRRRVAQKLRVCLPVMVYKSDPLPKKICQFCAARLDDVYEFREYCLNVYKSMHFKLLANKNSNTVKIFLDAMSNSPDPCQVQLCMIKQRAPPPLVPLPVRTQSPVDKELLEPLVELPCEVEIKEEPTDGFGKMDFESGVGDNEQSFVDILGLVGENGCHDGDDKKTSILERVLKGDLTANDCKDGSPKTKNSQWCCSPCNSYYKTKESLMKHVQFNCPRKYECGKCLIIFKSCGELTHHEEVYHSHRNEIKADDQQMNGSLMPANADLEGFKREPSDGIKNLVCPTCGKICTQQSALSNHMRTHEPKKHKCDICGRSFGLFIRLAAHKLGEHNQQPSIIPEVSTIEQEEALNDEREARKAREVKVKDLCRTFSETLEDNEVADERPAKRGASLNSNAKNVARCGICQQWFNDHTTMLNHLQTHSDNLITKNFNCSTCKKSFREKWQLQRHELSHKRAKVITYECSVCNKSFADKSQLESHEKIHVVDRTYRCAKCDKIFFKELSLITHQCSGVSSFGRKNPSIKSTATKDSSTTNPSNTPAANETKKYKCPKCPSTFDTSRLRNLHIRIHIEPKVQDTGSDEVKPMPKLKAEPSGVPSLVEPNVNIEEQNYTVPLKRTLIKTAGGYRCGVCKSPFVLRDLAVAHLRSAHPVMPYQCPYCKERFTTQYTFTHHIKTSHPNETG
ncbi:zinc finger protein 260-like [Microplitis mediator]|uniref:zinc finger protein 260-like n=1 Tax=Microplitis mediator TaxID=375433 RepID=UPI0025566C80|nr:zinc finger protein 260-like [Microplitis mediator]